MGEGEGGLGPEVPIPYGKRGLYPSATQVSNEHLKLIFPIAEVLILSPPPLPHTLFPIPAEDSLILPAAQAKDLRGISGPSLPSTPFIQSLRVSS